MFAKLFMIERMAIFVRMFRESLDYSSAVLYSHHIETIKAISEFIGDKEVTEKTVAEWFAREDSDIKEVLDSGFFDDKSRNA